MNPQPTGEAISPQHRSQKHDGRNRRAVFQAGLHHLIDPQPRQRPADPHHERHAQHAFENEIQHPQQVAQVKQKRIRGRVEPQPMRDRHGPVPAAEKQNGRQPADGKHRPIFRHEEKAPAQAGVFGVKPGHELAFRLRQIERSPVHAGDRAGEIDPKDDERKRIVQHEPVDEPAFLHLPDFHQVHRPRDHHRHDDAHPQRHLVANDLGRLAHRPEQRPFRRRRIAGQNHPENFQPQHGNDEKHADIHRQRDPIEREGQRGISRKRGAKAHVGGDAKQHPIRPVGHQVFFGEQFQAVGQRLQPAEFPADAGRPQPILNPPGDFALHPDEAKRAASDDIDQQGGLDHCRERIGEPRSPAPRIIEILGHRLRFILKRERAGPAELRHPPPSPPQYRDCPRPDGPEPSSGIAFEFVKYGTRGLGPTSPRWRVF